MTTAISETITITRPELIMAIQDEIDVENITQHELREMYLIIENELTGVVIQEKVRSCLAELICGVSQTELAWDGCEPCCNCPDRTDETCCSHEPSCRAYAIYESVSW